MAVSIGHSLSASGKWHPNENPHWPGDICHWLSDQPFPMHIPKLKSAWTCRISRGLCTSLSVHQAWSSHITFGMHITSSRRQMWGRPPRLLPAHCSTWYWSWTSRFYCILCALLRCCRVWTSRISLGMQTKISDRGLRSILWFNLIKKNFVLWYSVLEKYAPTYTKLRSVLFSFLYFRSV